MTIWYVDDDDCDVKFPSEMIVCPSCRGTGSHVNRAIDGNGITSSEMYELGDDFMDDYMTGRYDVTCVECNGANVIEVVIEELLDHKQLKEYRDMQDYESMVAAERRAGC